MGLIVMPSRTRSQTHERHRNLRNDRRPPYRCLGVAVIVAGLLFAVFRFFFPEQGKSDRYRIFRQNLGRGILLGLEFLIAADIIRTVAVTPTLNDVFVLGIIVLIRTFLSLSLQVEIDGRWPWQSASGTDAKT